MYFHVTSKMDESFNSNYSLREVAIILVDKFSITNEELTSIVQLQIGGIFHNNDLTVTRIS